MSDKGIGVVVCVVILVLLVGAFWFFPTYSVWTAEMEGKAELAQAEWNKQVSVLEAKARMESAKYQSDAEIQRAKGVAEANKIIGDSLKGNSEYLRYLWIDAMREKDDLTTVYVPTEAGLPILEAGRKEAIGSK